MYRIVKEINKLTGRTLYIIEQKKRFFFWTYWTKDLDIELHGLKYVSAPTLERAKYNLQVIEYMKYVKKILKKQTLGFIVYIHQNKLSVKQIDFSN